MNKLILFLAIATMGFYMASCGDDGNDLIFDYHAHINSPDASDKHLDDTLHINVEFESHTGEAVHNIKVRIYNVTDTTVVIYNKPDQSHVHEESGSYTFEDDFVLSTSNGLSAHTDWVLEAKVWGDTPGFELESSTVQFHVHP